MPSNEPSKKFSEALATAREAEEQLLDQRVALAELSFDVAEIEREMAAEFPEHEIAVDTATGAEGSTQPVSLDASPGIAARRAIAEATEALTFARKNLEGAEEATAELIEIALADPDFFEELSGNPLPN